MKLRPSKTELRVLEDSCIHEHDKLVKAEREVAFLRESKAILYHEKLQLLEEIKSQKEQIAFLRDALMKALSDKKGGVEDVVSTSASAE